MRYRFLPLISILLLTSAALSSTLTVGQGKQYATIEAANVAAHDGDRIEIFPSGVGGYREPAVYVTKRHLQFIGMGDGVVLDGKGFAYSGVGAVPRAIFQVNPTADDVVIENLTLTGAHNESHNGAGVRINGAKGVTVRRCNIFGNDMGIMSNGAENDPEAGSGQLIELCTIHGNGDLSDPGYNHNLYLGGTSVTVQGCEIYGSTTGHNLKSRAHFNVIQYNYIHDAANREIDLVDAWDTTRPHSNSLLLGNLIVKDHPAADGNRTMIHFGQDGGRNHDGTIYLINNTIVTRFMSPVVQLSSAVSKADFENNVIVNSEQAAPLLVSLTKDHKPEDVTGSNNWMSTGYTLAGTAIRTRFGPARRSEMPPFVGDFRLPVSWGAGFYRGVGEYRDGQGALRAALPTGQFKAGPDIEPRIDTHPGAPILGGASVKG